MLKITKYISRSHGGEFSDASKRKFRPAVRVVVMGAVLAMMPVMASAFAATSASNTSAGNPKNAENVANGGNNEGVALLCDGEFQVLTGGVDKVSEEMFRGSVHITLIKDKDAKVEGEIAEIRLQAFEDNQRIPLEIFLSNPGLNPEGDLLAAESLASDQKSGITKISLKVGTRTPARDKVDAKLNAKQNAQPDDGVLSIETTDKAIILHRTVASGPLMRAKVDGKPLIKTRESIASVEMRLDRLSGNLMMVWRDDRVRDHKIPGAIRASQIQLRNEKIFAAECRPVRQRSF
jgi:hypothetical protein